MKQICGGCGNKMHGVCCIRCRWIDEEFRLKELAILEEPKRQRKQRISKEFTIDFDKKMLTFALKLLEFNKKLLIKDLVDLFEQEGLFRGLDQEAVIEEDGKKVYMGWAISFTIHLAKIWHKKGDVFIGTRQVKGHPYEIYLPEESEGKLLETQKMIEGVAEVNLDKVEIPFGKWKGEMLGDIGRKDPQYVNWLYEKCILRDGLFKQAVEICWMKLHFKQSEV